MDTKNENKSKPAEETDEYYGHNVGISSLIKRKRKGRKKQFCRPVKVPFNSDRFAEFVLKLDRLKNLSCRDPTKPGQYIIRASCMGKVYGHFLSGVVDMAAFVNMARTPTVKTIKDECPDIDISETIVLHILYKDLIDNPVVLTLLDGRHACRTGKEEPTYSHLTPMGFMCLDLLELVNTEMGFIDEYIEPWLLPSERKTEKFNCGTPQLQFSVSCSGGLPEEYQLRNGNIISLFVESMHRLPEEILQLDKSKCEMNVFITLPISDTESYLLFPKGQILDENSQQNGQNPNTRRHHHHSRHKSKHAKKDPILKSSIRHAHWASVLESGSEIPRHTAVIPGYTSGDHELSGDMLASADNDWTNHLTSSNPRIVWDGLHKIYIPANTYQTMLQDMSKNSIWPLEVAITVNKEIPKETVKPLVSAMRHGSTPDHSEHTSAHPGKKVMVATANASTAGKASEGSNNTGQRSSPTASSASEESHFETIIIYHGIAFFDLTQLLSPGTKTVRFASRLCPFKDNKLLLQKTIVKQSSFLTSIPGYLPADTEHKTVSIAATPSKTSKKGTSAYTPKDRTKESHGHHANPLENKASMEILSKPGSATNFTFETCPFIVFEMTMDHPVIPLFSKDDAANAVKEYNKDNTRSFPRRKVMNAKMAVAKYKRSVLQASAELCEIFHTNYLEEVVNDPRNSEMLDPDNPASSCDALKKGFLFYLNATGRYLILREHLRNSMSHIIQQRCLVLRPNGFHTIHDFQSYLHDMYIYLVDQMHDILTKTQMNEVDPFVSLSRLEEKRKPESEQSKVVQSLRDYGEEALAQGDFDNCHRIHLERICKSEEDPNAWTDFATMWLSRGDDRMAEIAVREALRINPEHIYALIIAGVIAAKHEDERAIDCAGTALGLHPTSPECMIILAMVYKLLNNDVAADYYFKYARYMHRVLTGADMTDMENEYSKLNTRFDTLNSTGSKVNYEELMKVKEQQNMAKFENDKTLATSAMPSSLKMVQNDPRAHKVKPSSKGKIDNTKSLRVFSHELKRVPSIEPKQNSTSLIAGQKGENTQVTKDGVDELPQKTKDAPFSTRKDSISSKPKPRKNSNFVLPHIVRPNFQFETEFSEEMLSMYLPPIGPSLQTPWDVTQTQVISPVKKRITPPKKIESAVKQLSVEEITDGAASQNETDLEREKSPPTIEKAKSIEENLNEFATRFDELYGEDDNFVGNYSDQINYPFEDEGEEEIYAEEEISLVQSPLTESQEKYPKTNSQEKNLKRGSAEKIIIGSPDKFPVVETPEKYPKVGSPLENVPNTASPEENTEMPQRPQEKASKTEATFSRPKTEEYTRKKYTKKTGSEYIWTAQLLLQLRLFDLMDGVLAREVHLNEKRNIQYLYLRSISLYLRHRSSEALVYIDEALDLDPSNATLWALKGHCYYRLQKPMEAIESYEKSLMLPSDHHNQHLVYLRFGSLCLDQGGEDSSLHLAKRVFQRGVHMYPSPYMWLAYGNTCYQLKQFEEAENAFAEANRVDNTSPLIWGHLALVSLARDNQALAEQSYKWAVRFGLRKGPMVEEIKRLQKVKGFGDPSFPRIPDCLPHDFYLRRVGRQLPFDMYKEALFTEPPKHGKKKYYDTEREQELKRRLDETQQNALLAASNSLAASEENKNKEATDGEEEDTYVRSETNLSTIQMKKNVKDKKKPINKKHEDGKAFGSTKDKLVKSNHNNNKRRSTDTGVINKSN